MSNSLDTVRSGIIKFKQELSKVVQNKIKKLEQYVWTNSLDKGLVS